MTELLRLNFFEDLDLIIATSLIFCCLVLASILLFVVGKLKPNIDGLKELNTRTRSWWIMASILIGATILNTALSHVVIACLSFAAFRDMYSLIGFRKSDRRAIFLAIISIPIQYYFSYMACFEGFIIFIPVVMFLLLPLRLVIKGDTNGVTLSMSMLQWILMLTVFGLSHMAYLLSLPDLPSSNTGGRGLLLFLLLLTGTNDVVSFVISKLFGKYPVLPSISNSKTWGGFICGLICTSSVGYLLSFLTPFSTPMVLFVSSILAFSGFSGDVVMTFIRNDLEVVNRNLVVNEHGGTLNLVDSLAYTAPTFFYLVYYLAY